jgi:hypothetical protein
VLTNVTFKIGGKEYLYEGKLTVKDAMFIHEKSGVGVVQLGNALLFEGNPNVIAAWVYVLKRQAGEAVQWKDIENLDITGWDFVLPDPDETDDDGDDESGKEPAAKATDPTSVNGATPVLATAVTS